MVCRIIPMHQCLLVIAVPAFLLFLFTPFPNTTVLYAYIILLHVFKLHFICNEQGEIIMFCHTEANVDNRAPKAWTVLGKRIYGKLFADRGYISLNLFDALFADGVQSGDRNQKQDEEQAYATMGQDYAQKKV